MIDQQNKNEAAYGGSALTAELGALADQFESHALSRSIDDVEAAGRAMRAAADELARLYETATPMNEPQSHNGEYSVGFARGWNALCRALKAPNAKIEGRE